MRIRHAVAGLAVSACVAAPAAATMATPPAPSIWQGGYVGVFGGPLFALPDAIFGWAVFGTQIGVNAVNGRLLLGTEMQFGGWTDFFDRGGLIQFNARFGVILGRVLLYAEGGIGTYPGEGPHYNAGGGAEIAIGEAWSIFGEAKVESFFSPSYWLRTEFGVNWRVLR